MTDWGVAEITRRVGVLLAAAVLVVWVLRRQTWRPRPAPTLGDSAERLAIDERARRAEGQ